MVSGQYSLDTNESDVATIYEVDSSQVPMLSNSKLVTDVIRTAANA